MRLVPAATVVLGSGSGRFALDPEHTARIASFFMDVTEVTATAYEACVTAGACERAHTDRVSTHCNFRRLGAGEHPINCVTLAHAVAYCAWVGKRLPTADEWEYAARGTDRRRYPWGSEPPTTQPCWAHGRSKGEPMRGTCRAGSRTADVSPFGILDMSGNVAEWTSTMFCSFNDPKRCAPTTVCGSYWNIESARGSTMSVEHRLGFPPASQADAQTGFRCARSVNACASDEDCTCRAAASRGDCLERCIEGSCVRAEAP